ncbi:type II toxin-antitoxin system VapC family toxin [Microbacterium sp.]|uniref:type II toxin-antitoxin system VapC family toxin n=1 Tax=Microbacterium sp. TaxID=51671 RepID=UPI003C74A99A
MTAVVDASALLDAILPSLRQSAALAALEGHSLFAPAIIDLEVLSALGRLVRAEQISTDEADRAVVALRDAPVRRIPIEPFIAEVWALRQSLRISDAFCVVAARELGASLVTSDGRLSRAPQPGVTVTLLR